MLSGLAHIADCLVEVVDADGGGPVPRQLADPFAGTVADEPFELFGYPAVQPRLAGGAQTGIERVLNERVDEAEHADAARPFAENRRLARRIEHIEQGVGVDSRAA